MDVKAYLEAAKERAAALLADGQVERRHLRDAIITAAKLDSTVYGSTAEVANVATTEAAGSSDLVPRADHVHAITKAVVDSLAIDHGLLTGLADDDHTQYLKEKASGGVAAEVPTHTHADAANAGTIAHSATTGQTTDDHHAKSHTHNADGSGSVAHSSLTGIGANDHHAQSHGNSDHTDRTRREFLSIRNVGLGTATRSTVGASPDLGEVLLYADAARQDAYAWFVVPNDYVAGTSITIGWYVNPQGGAGTETVRLLTTRLVALGGAISATGGTVTTDAVLSGTNTQVLTQSLGSSDGTTNYAAGDLLRLTLERNAAHANDTLSANLRVVGWYLDYTADM